MADLPNPPILTDTDGDYDFRVIAGVPYMFTLKGVFGGATVTMQTANAAFSAEAGSNVFADVIDGAFTDVAEHEIIPDGNTIRLVLSSSSGTTSIAVTYAPIAR